MSPTPHQPQLNPAGCVAFPGSPHHDVAHAAPTPIESGGLRCLPWVTALEKLHSSEFAVSAFSLTLVCRASVDNTNEVAGGVVLGNVGRTLGGGQVAARAAFYDLRVRCLIHRGYRTTRPLRASLNDNLRVTRRAYFEAPRGAVVTAKAHT